jgi:hypothetical protein
VSTTSGEHGELRASNLELYFDLVFTITQLTALVEHHRSLLTVARAGLVFAVLYWMRSGYAWPPNPVPPRTTSRGLLLVCEMAAFPICALAIPQAFEGTAFALFAWLERRHGDICVSALPLVAVAMPSLMSQHSGVDGPLVPSACSGIGRSSGARRRRAVRPAAARGAPLGV